MALDDYSTSFQDKLLLAPNMFHFFPIYGSFTHSVGFFFRLLGVLLGTFFTVYLKNRNFLLCYINNKNLVVKIFMLIHCMETFLCIVVCFTRFS